MRVNFVLVEDRHGGDRLRRSRALVYVHATVDRLFNCDMPPLRCTSTGVDDQ